MMFLLVYLQLLIRYRLSRSTPWAVYVPT